MPKKEKPYLPKMRTSYHPTDKECRKYATDSDVKQEMPNPATNPIVTNNIACSEFDYTQDMMSSTSYFMDDDK